MLSAKECLKEAETCRSLAARTPNNLCRQSFLNAAARWNELAAAISEYLRVASD